MEEVKHLRKELEATQEENKNLTEVLEGFKQKSEVIVKNFVRMHLN